MVSSADHHKEVDVLIVVDMGQPYGVSKLDMYPLVYPYCHIVYSVRRSTDTPYTTTDPYNKTFCMLSPLPPNNASPTSQHLWDCRLRGQNDESGKSTHHETSL